MVKKIWILMVMILLSLVSTNAISYIDSNNYLQIECLADTSENVNQMVDFPNIIGVNITIQNGCLALNIFNLMTDEFTDKVIRVNGYNGSENIRDNLAQFSIGEYHLSNDFVTIQFENSIIDFKPKSIYVRTKTTNWVGTGIQNFEFYVETGQGFSTFNISNYNSYKPYADELTPDFAQSPVFTNLGGVITNYMQVSLVESTHLINITFNIYNTENSSLVDTFYLQDINLNPEGACGLSCGIIENQIDLTPYGKGLYIIEIILENQDFPYQTIYDKEFGTVNRLIYTSPVISYGYLYNVPNLESNAFELPLNNNTLHKFNLLGQSFKGNNETLVNASFYMMNMYAVTPLYDINVRVFETHIDEFGNYYCGNFADLETTTPVSTGFIDKNLITNEIGLVTFQLTPYLLKKDVIYCMGFTTNSQDEINPNEVVMFLETSNPYDVTNGNFLKSEYNRFAEHEGNDLAGYIYSVPQEQEILGCTDTLANNYNPLATQDDLSCTYNQEEQKSFISRFMVDIGNGISGFLGGITETLASYLLIIGTIGAVIYMFYLVAKMIQDSLNLRKK